MGVRRWGSCWVVLVATSACGGTQATPPPPTSIEVGDSDPEPAPAPKQQAQGSLNSELLGAVREALMDQTYGTPGDPDRFLNAYLWSLFVPRTGVVPERDRYNVRFLQENPAWEYDDPREGLADRLFAVPRDGKFLLSAFRTQKSWLYSNLSAAEYRELHLDVYVSGLLRVNRHMFSRPDATGRLRAMIVGLAMEPGGDPGVPYPPSTVQYNAAYFKDLWSHETAVFVESALCHAEPECVVKAKRLTLWFHGFWLRRNNEQNVTAVMQILEELEKHYSG